MSSYFGVVFALQLIFIGAIQLMTMDMEKGLIGHGLIFLGASTFAYILAVPLCLLLERMS